LEAECHDFARVLLAKQQSFKANVPDLEENQAFRRTVTEQLASMEKVSFVEEMVTFQTILYSLSIAFLIFSL
jgi:hypothetical protein